MKNDHDEISSFSLLLVHNYSQRENKYTEYVSHAVILLPSNDEKLCSRFSPSTICTAFICCIEDERWAYNSDEYELHHAHYEMVMNELYYGAFWRCNT